MFYSTTQSSKDLGSKNCTLEVPAVLIVPAIVFQFILVLLFFMRSLLASELRMIVPVPPLSKRILILTGLGLPSEVRNRPIVIGIKFCEELLEWPLCN